MLGGPKRLYRRARKAITGKEEARLPKSLLPKDIEKALRKLGTDGDQVRGTIERDFAKYLDDRAKERRKEGIVGPALPLAVVACGRRDRAAARCLSGCSTTSRDSRSSSGKIRERGLQERGRRTPGQGGGPSDRRDRRRVAGPRLARRASGGMADAPALGAGAA